jgi:hypothetical protein
VRLPPLRLASRSDERERRGVLDRERDAARGVTERDGDREAIITDYVAQMLLNLRRVC